MFFLIQFCISTFNNLKIGITGGSYGLGLSISQKLIKLGAHITIFDIKNPPLNLQNKVKFINLDLNNTKDISSFDFDIFISNAAYFNGIKNFNKCSVTEILKTINVNVIAPLILYKNVRCKKHVFINSVLSLKGFPKLSLYCASKSFINVFNECVSKENRNTVIIYLGKMNTDMFKELKGKYMVDKDVAADKILKCIEDGKLFLFLPWYFRYTCWINVMCTSIQDFLVRRICRIFEIN